MMKFVVIGCGNIAQRCSIPALMNSGVTEVVCVVDTDENKRAIVAERFGVPFETDLQYVLNTMSLSRFISQLLMPSICRL